MPSKLCSSEWINSAAKFYPWMFRDTFSVYGVHVRVFVFLSFFFTDQSCKGGKGAEIDLGCSIEPTNTICTAGIESLEEIY